MTSCKNGNNKTKVQYGLTEQQHCMWSYTSYFKHKAKNETGMKSYIIIDTLVLTHGYNSWIIKDKGESKLQAEQM